LEASGEGYTALFYWTAAVQTQDEIRRVDVSFAPSPKLYLSLANAQRRLSQETQAWESYLQAASLCSTRGDKPTGMLAIKAAQELAPKVQLNDDQKKQLDLVAGQLNRLPGSDRHFNEPGASTRPAGLRSLPSEYRTVPLTPDQETKLGSVNEKYEQKLRESPLQSNEIAKQRDKDLDAVLDPSQREQVNKSRGGSKGNSKNIAVHQE
jgi:hypothetical protein